jgi:drug/metabolite transporter (DMT)-like permease
VGMDRAQQGILRCAIAAGLFGATTPLAARIAEDTSAPLLAGLLYVGAAAAVIPVVHRRPLPAKALRSGTSHLAVAVLAGGLVGPLLLAAGLARTPGATASLLLNLELVATTVLAALFFGEHLGRRVVSGTMLVVISGAMLAWSGAPELRWGAVLIVGACVCWGLDNCVTADLAEIAPEHITLAKGVIAGGTNLVLGFALGGSLPTGGQVVLALVVGALGYGVSITLWVAGARDIGAARGQLVFATAPFFGVVVAWLLLGEQVRGAEVAALGLAAIGVAAVVRSGHEHPHEHPAVVHEHDHQHDDDHHDHDHEGVGAWHRHSHPHEHAVLVHAHPHVPDVHHRHDHED